MLPATFVLVDGSGVQESVLQLDAPWTLHGPSRALALSIKEELRAGDAPVRMFFSDVAQRNLDLVRALCSAMTPVQPALSVKTNPRPELLRLACERGFFAEVISPQELAAALEVGFTPQRLLYNGPRRLERGAVHCAFADSAEAFGHYCTREEIEVAGLRIRPSGIDSRFGVQSGALAQCAQVAKTAGRRALGVSFHARPEDYGQRLWSDIAAEVAAAAAELQELSGIAITVFDGGGGWTPDQLTGVLDRQLPQVLPRIQSSLPSLSRCFIEPGQGIARPVEALATHILEIRHDREKREAIVDAGYPDLPQTTTFAHRVFYAAQGTGDREIIELGQGVDRIAGCTCLEYDIVRAAIALPRDAKPGDVLIVADAGAYDASMAFAFAQGERG